jgi:DNA-binding transcriptional MerR regulator
LSLAEINDFLDVHDAGDLPCEHIKVKLEDKLIEIDKQIRELLIFKGELEKLLSGWESIPKNLEATICPIIEA